MKNFKVAFSAIVFVLASSMFVFAQNGYQKPPREIMDVLDAPAPPLTSISPAKDKIALLEPLRYPPITELAQPMLRLAGLRINPNTTGQHRQFYYVKVTLKNMADGKGNARRAACRSADYLARLERGRKIYRRRKRDADRHRPLDYRDRDGAGENNQKSESQHGFRQLAMDARPAKPARQRRSEKSRHSAAVPEPDADRSEHSGRRGTRRRGADFSGFAALAERRGVV